MKPHRKKRLIAVLGSVAGVGIAVALILVAMWDNADFFYDPTDIANGKAPINKSIRVGGLVVPGTVTRGENPLDVMFTVRDNQNELVIQFSDVLPDLFKEGQGIVATGKLVSPDRFVASSVLAKHDENYMSPEVARALEESGHPGDKVNDTSVKEQSKTYQ